MDTIAIQEIISTAMANPAAAIEEQNWEPGESRPDLSQIIGSPVFHDPDGVLMLNF